MMFYVRYNWEKINSIKDSINDKPKIEFYIRFLVYNLK
jgi:hypothetical protein